MTREFGDVFLAELRDTHADRFLTFLEDEFAPVVAARYRVAGEGSGFFGFSYGGPFALYAFLRRSAAFSRFGVASRVVFPDSHVHALARNTPRSERISAASVCV